MRPKKINPDDKNPVIPIPTALYNLNSEALTIVHIIAHAGESITLAQAQTALAAVEKTLMKQEVMILEIHNACKKMEDGEEIGDGPILMHKPT
jgi:hypothetical protein